MKTCFRLSVMAAFLVWMAGRPATAQPVQEGFAVGTCYSGLMAWPSVPDGYVVGLMDVRQANLQPLDQNWGPTTWHGPISGEWKRSNLGEVFGTCLDLQGNIYVSATIVYGNSTPGGPGGSGAIYRLDAVTGNITTFATLPNGGNVGLGNIAWDPVHNQMFATNFEDGKIYRISSAGTVLDAYDPFADDVSSSGLAPYGELVWGIGYYNDRVYFGRWVENTGNISSVSDNEVWSIPINTVTGQFIGTINGAGDYTNNETLTFAVPAYTSNWSNPVSDIAFATTTGRMLIAERTVQLTGSGLFSFGWPAHQSRVLEFSAPGWLPSGNTFSIGAYTYMGMQANSAGGVDYAYASFDYQNRRVVGCDEAMWASGDALHFGSPYPDVLYGWQWLPWTGGNVTNSVIVDADGNVTTQDKTQVGDIEVFKHCEQPHGDPCDGIDVGLTDLGDCCYELSIGGIPAGSGFTSVTATLITAGVTFTGVVGPTGWGVSNSGTTATWNPGGAFPAGTTNGLEFCISTTVSAPQQVLITLHAKDGTICEFLLDLNCEPPPAGPCVVINDEEIECKGSGPNGWTYEFSFTVTNYSPFSQSPWNLPAENLLVSGTGLSVSPSWTSLVPSLNYGGTSGTLNYTLSGSGLQPGDSVCLFVQLHGAQVGDDYRWCCPPEMIYFVLPPCADCCDSVDIRISQNSGRQVGNTAATVGSGSVTVAPGPITKVQASVMSVARSRVWCPDANGLYVPVANPTSIGALITGASISPSMPVSAGLAPPTSEVIWGTVYSGVNFNPGSVNLNLSFPGTNLGWRCQDTLTVCVRYTFTDTACRTCDTVVYYTVPRCGRVDIDVANDDGGVIASPATYAEQVQGGGIPIGEPLYSDVVQGPALSLSLSSHTQGVLAIAHWWQGPAVINDKIRVVRVKVVPEPGIDITSLRSEEGAVAEVVNRVATLDLDLNEGETDNFNITFDNPTDAEFFALRVRYDYIDMDDPDVERLSREFVVYGDLNGEQGRISVDESDRSTPTLYKLLIGSNGENSADWISPACFRFTPPQGVRILASGPMPDSTFAEFHVLKSMSKESSMLLQLPSPGDFRKEYIAEDQSVALWLVLEGGGDLFDLEWEALNMNGEIIGAGDVQLSPTSTVYDGEDYVPGASIHLLETYPNPARDRVMTRFNLARTEEVTVSLYDMSGHEVSRVVDKVRLGAGSHEYELNLKSLSSGAYYIRMTTSAGTQTKSVVKQ